MGATSFFFSIDLRCIKPDRFIDLKSNQMLAINVYRSHCHQVLALINPRCLSIRLSTENKHLIYGNDVFIKKKMREQTDFIFINEGVAD